MNKWIVVLKDTYSDSVIREHGDFVTIGLPFFLPGTHDGVALSVKEDEMGRPIIGDCGSVVRYLEEADIDIRDYETEVDKICDFYNVVKGERSFETVVPTDQPLYFVKYVGYFLQAISLLANVAWIKKL